MKTIPTFLLLLIFAGTVLAQDKAYSAYLSSSLTLWERAVSDQQSMFDSDPSSDNRFELAQAQFGLLNATMKDGEEKVFNQYVSDTEAHLEQLIEEGVHVANSKALLSGLYGLKIGHSSWKGMFLGSKSADLASEALKEDPKSPIVQKMYANNKFFTPSMWGGDVTEAIEAYEQSIKLFEERGAGMNWMYLDNFAWLGQAYQNQGNTEAAKATYERGLSIEQDFGWIKYGLLPALAKQ